MRISDWSSDVCSSDLALGIPWGAPATTETMLLLRNAIGRDAIWAAFGIGRHAFPMVAQALLLGGQIRVGLEDNFYLGKGVQAQSNAQLVAKAAGIAAALGRDLATPRSEEHTSEIESPMSST